MQLAGEMRLKVVVLAGVIGAAGFVAGRWAPSATEPHVEQVPSRTCARGIQPPVHVVADVEATDPVAEQPNEADLAPDDGGDEIADLLAAAAVRTANLRRTHNAIVGHVTEAQNGTAIGGVTVIVTSPSIESAQTAITDNNGEYAIIGLPTGSYLVTFYYSDITVERQGIAVSTLDATEVVQRLDLAAPGDNHITITNDYEQIIPVPGRTFESVLGAAAGAQNDGLGVSFSGVTSLENTYVIDEL